VLVFRCAEVSVLMRSLTDEQVTERIQKSQAEVRGVL
jgi:hypothetical protein